MKLGIKLKSSIFLVMLLSLTVFLLGFLILQSIQKNQYERIITHLLEQKKVANSYVEQIILSDPNYKEDDLEAFISGDISYKKNGPDIARQLGMMMNMRVILYDRQGGVIGDSVPFAPETNIKNLLSYALMHKIAYQEKGDTFYFLAPLDPFGAIQFEYSLKETHDFYEYIKELFIQIGSILVIISFLIAYFYFYRITDGILKLKNIAGKILREDYPVIVPFNRKDELGELSQEIYVMSNQLQENIAAMQQEQVKLTLAVKKLRELEGQQKTFIGNITHEFKTPLSIIIAYLDTIEMYDDDLEMLASAKKNIRKETKRLYELVEKVLHLATIDKYDFELHQEKIEVKSLLLELCERMKGKAERFEVSIHTDLQVAEIWMDRESIFLIFINLLDNAIKYNTQHGDIFVSCRVETDHVTISIQDNGIGIPTELHEKVFDPFFRVNLDRSRLTGGAGLGLPLVKQLVEKQQGTIKISDQLSRGTEIILQFPCFKDELKQTII